MVVMPLRSAGFRPRLRSPEIGAQSPEKVPDCLPNDMLGVGARKSAPAQQRLVDFGLRSSSTVMARQERPFAETHRPQPFATLDAKSLHDPRLAIQIDVEIALRFVLDPRTLRRNLFGANCLSAANGKRRYEVTDIGKMQNWATNAGEMLHTMSPRVALAPTGVSCGKSSLLVVPILASATASAVNRSASPGSHVTRTSARCPSRRSA